MYPYLFEQKWLPSYIVFICIGIAAAFLCCKIVADKTDVSYEVFSTLCIMFLISLLTGFASARLFQMLYNFIETGKVGTGITFLGGLIGGVATFALMYFIMRKKLKGTLPIALRMAVPAVSVAHAFGRIGCFFAGCCYGKQTDGFIAVTFPFGDGQGVPRIPTQLIEAIFLFALFAVLIYLAVKKKDILCAFIYSIGYSVFRFVIEFFRDDDRGELVKCLSPSQFICLIIFIASIIGITIALIIKSKSKASKT